MEMEPEPQAEDSEGSPSAIALLDGAPRTDHDPGDRSDACGSGGGQSQLPVGAQSGPVPARVELRGKWYTANARGRLDLSSIPAQRLGRIDVTKLARWLATPTSAGLTSLVVVSTSSTSLQETYTLTAAEEKVDLRSKHLGPADANLVAAFLQRPKVCATIESIDLSGCDVTEGGKNMYGLIALCAVLSEIRMVRLADCGLGPGSTTELSKIFTNANAVVSSITLDINGIFGELYSDGDVKEVDKFAGDCDAFFAALKGSNIVTLSLQNTGIGPVTLQKLATSLSAVLTSINCLANQFGEDDLATLLTAIEGTSVRSLCGLTEGQTTADFSGQNLGPIDMKIMAAECGFQGFIAAVARLILDDNNLVGDKYWSDIDTDITGVSALFVSLKTSSVTELSLAKCRLGPGSLAKLAEYLREATAVVNSLTVDSTGDSWNNGGPKTYTLTVGEEKIDLSQKNLGPADVALVATWLQRPEVGAVLNSVTVDSTGDMRRGRQLTYTLTTGEEKIDLSKKNLGSADVALVAAWLQRPEVMAAVARLMLNGNMVTGSREKDYCISGVWECDRDISGLISICDALPALKKPIDLDLSNCGLSVNGVNLVAHAIEAGSVGAIGLAGCQLEPQMVAQVLSIASEVSRSRLRVAQVLAFCCALHDRMGADSAICDMVEVHIWHIVASIVHALHGHEALCSTLGRQSPWYEVRVRGMVPEGVPHSEASTADETIGEVD